MYIHVILAGEASQKKKDNNKVKTTVWPPLLPIKPLFPACFCGYSLMFSYIQRSLQNNILSNIEKLKMLKKNNTIMCDTYIRLYYNSFHSAAFITNILYRDQGFFLNWIVPYIFDKYGRKTLIVITHSNGQIPFKAHKPVCTSCLMHTCIFWIDYWIHIRLSSVIYVVDLCEKYQNFVRLIICHAFGSGVLFHTY